MTYEVPGIYDVDDATYFAHDALSHSDLKLLLSTSPAKFRWIKDNRVRENKPQFDFGHVVHELVLGEGAGIDVIDAENWRTNAAKEARDAAHEAGRAPILAGEYEVAKACAEAVTRHPVAAKLLSNRTHTEVALLWRDGDLMLKAKIDGVAGRFGFDLKTTDQGAGTDSFARSAAKYAYATQAAFYSEAMRQCMGIDSPEFLFVVVETEAPHLVNVVQIDTYDLELADRRNRSGIELYRRCVESGEWGAYGDGINVATLPRWWEIENEIN